MQTVTRRDAIRVLVSASAGAWASAAPNYSTPPLAPGAPTSPERMALIDAFREKAATLAQSFEKREHKSDWLMPYRLFRPAETGKAPLVLYLHGSGGLGDDNENQLGLGNVFGTQVWALPENQKRFPCYVLAPQTDRGWIKYGPPDQADGPAKPIPGFGDGARLALEIIASLRREFAIDERRIYVTGQSMGGAGTWHLTAQRPKLFAAAVICCGSPTSESGAQSAGTPLWNFHGDSDQTVPVAKSRDRIAAMRKAGAHPLYTEYAGVDHNVWQWAFTEPELSPWVFAQHRPA